LAALGLDVSGLETWRTRRGILPHSSPQVVQPAGRRNTAGVGETPRRWLPQGLGAAVAPAEITTGLRTARRSLHRREAADKALREILTSLRR
jgi:hypothetical protein